MKLESVQASKKTSESMKYGEDLMEALEMAENFRQEVEQYEIELEGFKGQNKK